jgi:hypothetical protein
MDVAIAQNFHGQNPRGICDWYGVGLDQVHAALAYYYSNQVEIDQQIAEQIALAEHLAEESKRASGTQTDSLGG